MWTLPPRLHHGDEHGAGGAEARQEVAEGRGPPLPPGETGVERPGQYPGEGQARGSRDGQGPGHQGENVHGQATHHRLDENDRDGAGSFDPRRHQEPCGDHGLPGGHNHGGHDQGIRRGNEPGLLGGLMEVRPRQLEPYANWTLEVVQNEV